MNDHYKQQQRGSTDREMRDQSSTHHHHNSHHHHHQTAGGGSAAATADGGSRTQTNKYDDPPNSRLFIVCGKSITEDDFKEAFEPFGVIEEIWVLKDKARFDHIISLLF